MAEGINRPTVKEPLQAWSRRLQFAEPPPDRFELAKLLAEHLVEEFAGFQMDPQRAFAVHVRGEGITIRCLSERVYGWHLARRLAKSGFGGRTVTLEKAWTPRKGDADEQP